VNRSLHSILVIGLTAFAGISSIDGQTTLPIIDPNFDGIDANNGIPAGSAWTYHIGPNWEEDVPGSASGTAEDSGFDYPGLPNAPVGTRVLMQIGETGYSVYQSLFGNFLKPYTRYTLQAAIGKRTDWASGGNMTTNNLASFGMYVGNPSAQGGTRVMERTVNWWNFVVNNREWTDFTVEFITGANPPPGTIVVEFSNPSVVTLLNNGRTNAPRAHFDNLILTEEFVGPTDVTLGIEHYSPTLIRLHWTNAAMGFNLQAADALGSGFTTLSPIIFTEGDSFAVYEEFNQMRRLYRLKKDP
jgi:hypothetical protein